MAQHSTVQALDGDQEYALHHIIDQLGKPDGKKYFYITGFAGTGKTHLLKHIISAVSDQHETVALIWAGIASQTLGGVTIMSYCGLEFDRSGLVADTGYMRCRTELTGRMISGLTRRGLRQRIRDRELILIFDEVVAVHDTVLAALSAAYQELRRGLPGCHEPFGGMAVIFSGDACQLGRMELKENSPQYPSSALSIFPRDIVGKGLPGATCRRRCSICDNSTEVEDQTQTSSVCWLRYELSRKLDRGFLNCQPKRWPLSRR